VEAATRSFVTAALECWRIKSETSDLSEAITFSPATEKAGAMGSGGQATGSPPNACGSDISSATNGVVGEDRGRKETLPGEAVRKRAARRQNRQRGRERKPRSGIGVRTHMHH
jgi:hypothetical protein